MLRVSKISAAIAHPRTSAAMAPIFRGFASTTEKQDVVIIGGGPGGYYAAIKAAQLGLKTTCIESRGALGGTCLNVGCIPSKALLNASHKFHDMSHLDKMGITADKINMDFPKLMKFKESTVTGLTSGIEYLFKKNKVTYIKGHGQIKSGNTVDVLQDGKVSETVEADNIVIATGSEPIPLPGLEIDEEKIVSSTGALSLKEIPKKMIVIGAGVIGLELGSVYARLGSEVEVVEFGDRCCPAMDKELSSTFQKSLKKQGLKFTFNSKVTGATKNADGSLDVTIEGAKDGKESTTQADVVLVAIGRRPVTTNLGLENIGIETDKAGRVEVDGEFRTKSMPSVRAIGDVISGPMLAHKAEEEGFAVAEMLATGHGHVNYDCIPGVVYTHPEVADVGKTEEQLKEEGIEYVVGKFPMSANSRARANDDSEGFVKVLADKKTDRILGVHIIGDGAGELIGQCVLAMEYGASSEDVGRVCQAHPTLSEGLKEAAMAAAFGKPIHF